MTELGLAYRDKISGLEGIAVGRAEYLYGVTRVLLAYADTDGKPGEQWLEEGRVEPLGHQPRALGFGA